MKKQWGILTLFFSVILLSTGISKITGNVIGEYFLNQSLFISLSGLLLLLASVLIFTSRKTLDAIIVPTGDDKADIERPKQAARKKANYYLISGKIDKKHSIKNQRTATIYRELRKYNIKPSKMKIEGKSKDSLENVLYSLKKLKDMKNIGIVSYPQHLKRFEYIIEKAKKEKIIPLNLEITYIPTIESAKDKIYGFMALLKEKYRLRNGIKQGKKQKTGKFGNYIKNSLEKFN